MAAPSQSYREEISNLSGFLRVCEQNYDAICTEDYCSSVISTLHGYILRLQASNHLELCDVLGSIQSEWLTKKENSASVSCTNLIPVYSSQIHYTGKAGRPKIQIDFEQAQFLQQLNFSMITISNILLISRWTLNRRLTENNNAHYQRYTAMSDMELEAVMRDIYRNHCHSGSIMMMGHLRSRGLSVQRDRVRTLLRNLDPASSARRYGYAAQRRVYSVPGPNYLWHVDGHHALIRWRLVTHGGIDGFSRLIVFLHCSSNNLAATVLDLFMKATVEYGLPSRVRGDYGVENNLVHSFMEERQGLDRGSFLRGRSVHNSRIERLWRDVYYGVIQTFYSLFYYLEEQELLDTESERDLFALHYMYIPRINQALKEFTAAFNHHGLRSERSWSPLQIWTNGALRMDSNGRNLLQRSHDDEFIDSAIYGIDPDEESEEAENNNLSIPQTRLQIMAEELCVLEELFDPLTICDDYGVELYSQIRELMSSWGYE